MSQYKLHLDEEVSQSLFNNLKDFINDNDVLDPYDVYDIAPGEVIEEMVGLVRVVMER